MWSEVTWSEFMKVRECARGRSRRRTNGTSSHVVVRSGKDFKAVPRREAKNQKVLTEFYLGKIRTSIPLLSN